VKVNITSEYNEKIGVKKEAYTTNITHLEKDIETLNAVNEWRSLANKRLDQTVLQTNRQIDVEWFRETEVMRRLTKMLQEWTNADCALLNAGILLESFPKGNITLNDIHRICPHPINPCTVMLNGDELMEVIRVAFTKELIDLPLKGFGFRGKVIGRFTFSGMSVFTRINEHGDETIIKVTKNGSPLKKEKRYLVRSEEHTSELQSRFDLVCR